MAFPLFFLEKWPMLFENKYLFSLMIFIAFFVVAYTIVFFVDKFIMRLAAKTKTKLDGVLIAKIKRPTLLLLLLIGLRFAITPLYLPAMLQSTSNTVLLTLIVLVVGYLSIRVFDILIDFWAINFAKKTQEIIDKSLVFLFQRFSRVLIVVFIFFYFLNLWGIDIGPLLASLGIAGLAVALALQTTLGNIFGGISLLIDRSIKVGDRIKLETGESGIVLDVGLRSTRIRTWNYDILVIPNGQLSNSKIENFLSEDRKARTEIEFSIAYGSDVDKVQRVVLKAMAKVNDCLKDPEPQVNFVKMGDSSLQFKAKFWVDDVDKRYGAQLAANKEIYNALNKEKIIIPFPQMDVHLHKK